VLHAVTGNVVSQEGHDMWYILMSLCTSYVFVRTVISIVRVTEMLEEVINIVVFNRLQPLHYINATLIDMIKPLTSKANQIHV